MSKELYERAELDVVRFRCADVITSSLPEEEELVPDNPWELPNKP